MSTELTDPSLGALGVQEEGEPTNPLPTHDAPPPGEELDENGEPKKKMGGFQKRIQKLTTRLAAQEEVIAQLRASAPTPRDPEAPKEPQPPDENTFQNYADYKAAERKYFSDLADFKAEMKFQERDKARARESESAKAKERETEAQATWAKRLEAAHAAHPDLEDLLEEDLPATPGMMQTIVASEYGGEMLHYLASHPEECRRIASLTPRGAETALGRIEDEISTKKPNLKRTTSAPAPLQPLKGSGTVSRDPASIKDDNEWYRARNAQRGR